MPEGQLRCACCDGTTEVKIYSFDLDLSDLALCIFCVWGPHGIYSGARRNDGSLEGRKMES